MATKRKAVKKAPAKKSAKKGSTAKKAIKKASPKKAAKKAKKNKLGVKNSLVNNINARKKKGVSRSKKKSTVDKEQYTDMQDNWGKKK
ncbi:hypothetical protein LZZ85_21565 [Terrimonas sp. NA20]|uniref:Uncharacterized protein n=1 Tax=Terrimonas ginsenosidimutans TaxID=2908004 RepID=A0ABS9KX65_9BACT|nr:hypothetical protein [Terrimonas ginsenosidimutans]MCG2616900.1 hypothetical protein [Terrimonas ginsenosidimutans]